MATPKNSRFPHMIMMSTDITELRCSSVRIEIISWIWRYGGTLQAYSPRTKALLRARPRCDSGGPVWPGMDVGKQTWISWANLEVDWGIAFSKYIKTSKAQTEKGRRLERNSAKLKTKKVQQVQKNSKSKSEKALTENLVTSGESEIVRLYMSLLCSTMARRAWNNTVVWPKQIPDVIYNIGAGKAGVREWYGCSEKVVSFCRHDLVRCLWIYVSLW